MSKAEYLDTVVRKAMDDLPGLIFFCNLNLPQPLNYKTFEDYEILLKLFNLYLDL